MNESLTLIRTRSSCLPSPESNHEAGFSCYQDFQVSTSLNMYAVTWEVLLVNSIVQLLLCFAIMKLKLLEYLVVMGDFDRPARVRRKILGEIFIVSSLFVLVANEIFSTIEDYHGPDSTLSGIADLMVEIDNVPRRTYYYPW